MILELILFVGGLKLCLSVEHSEVDFFVVSLFAPEDHGVVICFENEHISCPLVVH